MPSASFRVAGILPPITTPFDAHGDLDGPSLVSNIERYNTSALAGYVAFGSNGEAAHLNANERRRVLEIVRRTAAPGRTLVAGVHEQSTVAAIESAHRAADSGADAVLVITPYFYKGAMTQPALERFFLDVAEASPLPVLAYNIPQNTGVTVRPETLAGLADHPNMAGVKDSSGDLDALLETLRQVPEGFDVVVGNAGILRPALEKGAAGGILAVACVAPEACLELYGAVRGGDTEKAQALQRRLAPLARMVTVELGIPGLKVACELAGFQGGGVRGPLLPLPEEKRDRIAQVMQDSGFFPSI